MIKAKPPKLSDSWTTKTQKNYRASGTLGNPGTGAPSLLGTYNPRISGKADNSWPFVNDDYHTRLRDGKLIPMTPWIRYKHDWKVTSGKQDVSSATISPYYRYWTDDVNTYTYQTVIPQPWLPTQLTLEGIASGYHDEARYLLQAAASKIGSSGWDTLTFVVEFNKTVALFRNFLQNLINNLGRLNYTERSISVLAKYWLEGRYGWKILYHDMIDIMKAVNNINEGRKRYRDAVGYWINLGPSRTDTFNVAYGSLQFNTQYTDKIGVRGTIVADIEPPRFQLNPLTTSWEVLTFSFVVDWIINVGQFLEAISFLALAHEYTGAEGIVVQRSFKQTSVWTPASGWSGSWYTNSEGTATYVHRKPDSVATIPLPKVRLDNIKILDLCAIVIGKITKVEAVLRGQ